MNPLYQEKVYQGGDGWKVAKNTYLPANQKYQPSFDGTGSAAIWAESRPTHDVQVFLSNTGTFAISEYAVPVSDGLWSLQGVEAYKYGNGASDATISIGVSGSAGVTNIYSLNLSGAIDGQWLQPTFDTASIGTLAQTNKGDIFYVSQAAPSGSCGAVVTLRFGLASAYVALNP